LLFNKTIQKLAAGLMLLLFALSVTPKQLLHDAVTGHKHSYIKSGEHINLQAAKSNFQCNWLNDVVESPFTGQPGFQINHPAIAHSSYINYYILSYYSAERFFSSLRGPPSLV
jgi:hypothetical protein